MADLIVTIDGPAASGKSTVARLLARRLGVSFLDTGAMYRAVTLAAMNAAVNLSDEGQLAALMDRTEFSFSIVGDKMIVRVDGRDVTEQIRSPQVTANARYIAAAPAIRARLVEMQRQFAAAHTRIVTEGRDQGTVVFPDADVKFYLTADAAERANRRLAEMSEQGLSGDLEEIQQAIEQRDKSDAARSVGPMTPAADAVVVDTTDMSIEQVVGKLFECVKQRCSKKH
jgi:cytidylate kinase